MIELCPECENEFTLWLGRHPMTGANLENQSRGLHFGSGYPPQERVRAYLEQPVAKRGDHA